MVSNRRLQTAKYGYLIISSLLCLLGTVLICVPGFSLSLLCWIGGILLILFGAVKIIGYVSKDLYRLAFQFDLAFGILLIVLGGILIFRSDTMIHIIGALLGLCILADALLKVQISLDAKEFGIPHWWMIFSASIVTGLVGILLLFRPTESARIVMILLGVSLLAEGVLNLITVLTAVKIIRQQRPEDTDFFD